MATDVGDFPDFASAGGELGSERAAEQGAAAVPLAVGAYEDQRLADVGLPEAVMLSVPRAVKSRPRAARGSVTVVVRIQERPGAV